jgi:hypothetical protein
MLHDPRNELKIERNPVHSFGSLRPVTSEVAGSSPVVPAIPFNHLEDLSAAHGGRVFASATAGYYSFLSNILI